MLSKKSSLAFQFFLVQKLWDFIEIMYFFKKTSALSGQYLINQRALKVKVTNSAGRKLGGFAENSQFLRGDF